MPAAAPEKFTFTPFKEMKRDLARRAPYYLSDWKDGLNQKVVASTCFMVFTSIAPAITFLASEDARWITGQVLQVSGGLLL